MRLELIPNKVHEYYWEYDYNCAVTSLKVLAELLELTLHPQVLEAALGMHGAGKFRAQCGLVEGPLMILGIFGSTIGLSAGEIVAACFAYADSFESRFGGLTCRHLRPGGFNRIDPPHLCEKLTNSAILFAMEFISGLGAWRQ